VRLEFDLATLYDSNVYATHDKVRDDAVVQANARFTALYGGPSRQLRAVAHIEHAQHLAVGRETATSFGLLVGATRQARRAGPATLTAQFDRAIESRSDPEARASSLQTPRKIDIFKADASYAHSLGPLNLELSAAAQSVNYLDPHEGDRDLRQYSGSVRLGWRLLGAATSLFAEPFLVRRDFVRRVDLSGTNRDSSTQGLLVGVALPGSGLISGRIGAGVFRLEPDSHTLSAFTGFAASGEVTWKPQPRTALTLTLFSGDVATVRAGATGRRDASATLRLEQEVRHNLLLTVAGQWEQTRYRGAANADRDTQRLDVEASYLFHRNLALFARGMVAHRDAAMTSNRYDRQTWSIGIRYQR